MAKNDVYRLKVYLKGIKPQIWRRIEIPGDATFWDLASAIMDAMGWEGYHFFDFHVKVPGTDIHEYIGHPSEEFEETLPAWEIKLSDYLMREKDKCDFIYDYGDNWQHVVRLEAIHKADDAISYPVCLGGKRACPPEDCGGVPGYQKLLTALKNPELEDSQFVLEWVGDSYDPSQFDKKNVVFQNPDKRFPEYFGFPKPGSFISQVQSELQNTNSQADYSLHKLLSGMLKRELVIIARNHMIDKPNKMKKAQLVDTLKVVIPNHFASEFPFFTPDQIILMMGSIENNQERFESEGISLETFTEQIPYIKSLNTDLASVRKNLIQNQPGSVLELRSFGYLFLKGDPMTDGLCMPAEIQTVLIMHLQQNGDKIMDYQLLQVYIVALSNLYGYLSFKQLHKIFKKYSGSGLPFEEIQEYIEKLAERSYDISTDVKYFYTNDLDTVEYEVMANFDVARDYYFPTPDEIITYAESRCCSQAMETLKKIETLILNKTVIEDVFGEKSFTFTEAMQNDHKEILDDYAAIVDQILILSKMGEGLYQLLATLDYYSCQFDRKNDLKRCCQLFLELQQKTRIWPLKGHRYSDLK